MLIRLEDVQRDFHQGQVRALRDVSLSIDHGESLAILGPSGSGKSTLLQLLGLMDEPSSGRVIFESGEPRTVRERSRMRARLIGFVFQSFHLVPGLTAIENIQIPMFGVVCSRQDRQDRAAELLESVGLIQRARHFPSELSGGEQQRVAIARALANRPPLLLADEPTGNLDSKTSNDIVDLLLSLHEEKEMALVVVTHNPELADRFGRRVEMFDGRLREIDIP